MIPLSTRTSHEPFKADVNPESHARVIKGAAYTCRKYADHFFKTNMHSDAKKMAITALYHEKKYEELTAGGHALSESQIERMTKLANS